jgi:stage III sporulation protein AF
VLYVETIYLLARNIVFVILIAVFIEMLLPLKETRKSVEVVVGLFVLITLLNPIVSFIQQEPLIELEMAEGNEEQLQQILDQGKELQQLQTVQTESYYGKHLEEQIAAFACIVPEVEKADARVQFVSGSSQDEVGVIERIEIFNGLTTLSSFSFANTYLYQKHYYIICNKKSNTGEPSPLCLLLTQG